jgi:DNA-binding NarL/FixJ family response regulator
MSDTVTIVLVDDHHLVRQAVKRLLEAEPGFKVVGELASGLHVVDQVLKLRPNVLVVDLIMPGLGGMEVTRQVVRRVPATKVVVLSMSISEAHVLEALRSGASAYVRKDANGDDLIQAIHEVRRGHHYLSPPFTDNAIEAYRKRAMQSEGDPYDDLTTREREVFHLAAEGYGNVEIAPRLGISPRTVETHRARIMRKLGLKRPSDIVRYAIRKGILSGDDGAAAMQTATAADDIPDGTSGSSPGGGPVY